MYICTNVHTDERRRSRQTCTTKKKLRWCLTARTEVRRDRSRDGGEKERKMPKGMEKERLARRILRVLAALAYYLTPTYAQRLKSCHGRPFRRDPRPSNRFSQGRRLLIYGHCTASCRTTPTTHNITRVLHGSVQSRRSLSLLDRR